MASMTRRTLKITYREADRARIPDVLTEGAVNLVDLAHRGVVEEVGKRLRIRRQGGYCGLDVWLHLVVYLSAGAHLGLRPFWEDVLRPHARRLAALAGRRSLASPAAMSRALDSVEWELLRPEATWLLAGVPRIDDLLRHPAVQTYDALGRGWHVFDLDPTSTVFRQRALPSDDDLPDPRRRAAQTGRPGHTGRKRGEIMCRRVSVQHSGSGAWIHIHYSAGNGEGVVDLERALDAVVETRDRLKMPPERVLVRCDGEFGHVPSYTAHRKRGLACITRLNRLNILDDPEVLALLRSATWHRVPDSKAGPRRAAADLGILTIAPGERTRRSDGTRYEPIQMRVVASIFPNDGPAKRGKIIDGRQVELFAVDAPADAWPAPEAVAAFFGRNAEENRFAQDDRELGLDRIFSYNLAGQELAALVGLSLWNLRLVRGFELDTPPAERPEPRPRRAAVDESVPAGWPRDPVIQAKLAEIDWQTALASRPGWSWDEESGELHCQDGRGLSLTTVRPSEHAPGRTGVIFRRPTGGCEDCEPQPQCLRSNRARAAKHMELSISTVLAEGLRDRQSAVRSVSARPATIEPIDTDPGPLEVADSLFLPAAARQTHAAVCRQATLRIHAELPPAAPPQPRLVAVDMGDRQRRRKTWAQNVDRYALPPGGTIRIEVRGSPEVSKLLGDWEVFREVASTG